jgi:hypothetical protein
MATPHKVGAARAGVVLIATISQVHYSIYIMRYGLASGFRKWRDITSITSKKRKQKSNKQDKKGSARTTNPCALYAPHPSVGILHSSLFAGIADKVNIISTTLC